VKIVAVVDRIEGDTAVLLVGPDELVVNFPLACLPAVHEGSILNFTIEGDVEEEMRRRVKAEELLKRLLE